MNDFINDNSVKKIVENTLHGCDDGEMYLEDSLNESFVYDDNCYQLLVSCLILLL